MKKIKLIRLLSAVLVVAFTLLAFLPLQSVSTDGRNWMGRLDDATFIENMSIPGTHNSCATHSIGDVSGKCQTLSVAQQLDAGVRFLDIRLKLKDDKLVIVHDFVDQRQDFEPVMETIANFIRQNKSEFLVVSIKKDADTENSTVFFSTAVKEVLAKYSDVVMPNNYVPNTLFEARGKIFILSRFDDTYGIPAKSNWEDNARFELTNEVLVQDVYCVDNVHQKTSALINVYSYAALRDFKFIINFASCYYDDGFPPMYAGTPALEVNKWIMNAPSRKWSILVCDFMTEELAKIIYGSNWQ